MRSVGLLVLSAIVIGLCATGCEKQEQPVAETLGPMEPPPDVPPLPDLGPMDLPYKRGGTFEVEETKEGVKLKERVEAKVGVGKRGRRLEDPKMVKMIVTPAVTLFRAQERIAYEVALPKTMQIFEAMNGRKPNSHEEFMEKIIKEGKIELPELPAGQRYVYDPEQGQLMVERPAQ